jgi:hypothetical protein
MSATNVAVINVASAYPITSTNDDGARYTIQTARRATASLLPSLRANWYTSAPTARAKPLATSKSARRMLTPGTHDPARARIGTNGKKRRPSLATPS